MEHRTVSAGVIIRKKEDLDEIEVLLIQRAADDNWPLRYEVPRGKCDKEGYKSNIEILIKCLKREVKEETGLDIIPLKFIDKFDYISNEGKSKTTQYNFLCKMKDLEQKINLSKEHKDFTWVSQPGIVQLQVFSEEMKNTIIKAMQLFEGTDAFTISTNDNKISVREIKQMEIYKLLKENEEYNNKILKEGVWKTATSAAKKGWNKFDKSMAAVGTIMTAFEVINIARNLYTKYNVKCDLISPLDKNKRINCKINAIDNSINIARRNLNLCEYPSCREEVMEYIEKLITRKKNLHYSTF